MKASLAVRGLVLMIAVLAVGSCATGAGARNPAGPGTAAKPQAKVAKQRTVVAKVPVLVKETSFYADGLMDQYIIYKLDDAKKNLTEKTTYDAARPDPVERLVPEYKNGLLTAESTFDADSKLRIRRELAYDASGRLVSEKNLDGSGKIQSASTYSYDAQGRKVQWNALDGAGTVKATSSYAYDQNGLSGVAMKDSGGSPTGSIKLEYADGALSKRSYFASDGTLQKFESYAYVGGHLAALENRRADGTLTSKIAYEYGPIGEVAKASQYDAAGALKGYTTYEYVVREDSSVETYYE